MLQPTKTTRALARLLTPLVALASAAGVQPAAAQDAFYQATPAELAGPPGSVIRDEVTKAMREQNAFAGAPS